MRFALLFLLLSSTIGCTAPTYSLHYAWPPGSYEMTITDRVLALHEVTATRINVQAAPIESNTQTLHLIIDAASAIDAANQKALPADLLLTHDGAPEQIVGGPSAATKDYIQSIFESCRPDLPPGPVAVGDHWSAPARALPGAIEKSPTAIMLKSVTHVDAIDVARLKSQYQLKPTTQPTAETTSIVTNNLYLNLSSGRLLRLTISTSNAKTPTVEANRLTITIRHIGQGNN